MEKRAASIMEAALSFVCIAVFLQSGMMAI